MRWNLVVPWLAAVLMVTASATVGSALGVGDAAPEFTAESTHGTLRLADYRGQKHVLLAFYFKDFTSG